MKFRTVAILLIGAIALHAGDEIDPRAIEFSVGRLPAGKTEPYRYLRSESTYSIVVYGDNVMRRSDQGKPAYRVLGIERDFSFSELKEILTSFYKTFPTNAEVADKRLGHQIPFPNIIYFRGGWNEPSRDGPELVDTLSRQYGVGLFYCQLNSYRVDIKETKREGVPMYDQACRDYYLERLNGAVKSLKAAEVKQSQAK